MILRQAYLDRIIPLIDKNLIPQATFDAAKNKINSSLDFPEFFWYPVCYRKEEEINGCSKDTE